MARWYFGGNHSLLWREGCIGFPYIATSQKGVWVVVRNEWVESGRLDISIDFSQYAKHYTFFRSKRVMRRR